MNKFNVSIIVLCLLIGFTCNSCATLFSRSSEVPALTITSSVPNADVYINGKYVGTTPYSHFSDRYDVKKITVKKYGYKSQTQKPRKISNWTYCNWIPLYTFLWGFIVDLNTNHCYHYKSDTFHFELEKENFID